MCMTSAYNENKNAEEYEQVTAGQLREQDKLRIIAEVRRLGGCCNWVELCENSGLSKDRGYPLIGELIKEYRLKRLVLDPDHIPHELIPKLQYYWDRGIMYHSAQTKKYKPFNRFKWVALPEETQVEEGWFGNKKTEAQSTVSITIKR